MRKIGFLIESFGMGGSEKALVSLLNILPEAEYDITIFVFSGEDVLREQIRRHVRIEQIRPIENIKGEMLQQIKTLQIKPAMNLLWDVLTVRKGETETVAYKYAASRLLQRTKEAYDAIIYFSMPTRVGLVYGLSLDAKQHIAWVHMDISVYEKERMLPMREVYERYDRIVCVSEYCAQSFQNVFPGMEQKIRVMHNVIDEESIIEKSVLEPEVPFRTSGMKIFTCARLSHEKRPEWALQIARKLQSKQIDFVWYWAGDGEEREETERNIKAFGLEDNVVLLGNIINPYPYYRACDLYIQLSEHESYCLSLAEAVFLGANILSTDFQTAYTITKGYPNCKLMKDTDSIANAAIEAWENGFSNRNRGGAAAQYTVAQRPKEKSNGCAIAFRELLD